MISFKQTTYWTELANNYLEFGELLTTVFV